VKRRLWILILALIALAVLGVALLPRLRGAARAEEPQDWVPVIAGKPRLGMVERSIRVSGTLQPARTVAVTPKVPGRIERIFVEEGEAVSQGQLLVQIEDRAARLQMEQARAAWQAAEAQYEQARRGPRSEELENARALHAQAEADLGTAQESYRRAQALFAAGTIPKAQLEEAESRLRGARTGLENAGRTLAMLEQGAGPEEQEMARYQAEALRSAYELARLQVEFTSVRAPGPGVVVKVLKDEGNLAGTETAVLMLVQDDPLELEAAVPERYYGEVAAELKRIEARLTPEGYPGEEPVFGRVSAIEATVNPASRTFAVTVQVDNRAGRLRPGMYAEAELVLERVPDALLVPVSALLERGGQQLVFVLAPGVDPPRAVGRQVRTGIGGDEEVQVLSGLSLEDRIIVEGNAFLEDGQAVRLVHTP
jgi:HlyD family secretion protein